MIKRKDKRTNKTSRGEINFAVKHASSKAAKLEEKYEVLREQNDILRKRCELLEKQHKLQNKKMKKKDKEIEELEQETRSLRVNYASMMHRAIEQEGIINIMLEKNDEFLAWRCQKSKELEDLDKFMREARSCSMEHLKPESLKALCEAAPLVEMTSLGVTRGEAFGRQQISSVNGVWG